MWSATDNAPTCSEKKESKYQVAGSRERMLLMLLLGNLASVLADQARRYRAAR